MIYFISVYNPSQRATQIVVRRSDGKERKFYIAAHGNVRLMQKYMDGLTVEQLDMFFKK